MSEFLVLEYLLITEPFFPHCRGGMTCSRLWSIIASSPALYVWSLRVCSLQPRDIHSLQMQLAKHLPSLWSALSFFLALTCPSFFWKERGYTSANETMTGLGRLWTVWRLGLSGTHTMKGRCSLSVKFSSLLQPGRLARIIEKVYHCSKESLLVIVITAAPKTSPLHASVTEIFTIT